MTGFRFLLLLIFIHVSKGAAGGRGRRQGLETCGEEWTKMHRACYKIDKRKLSWDDAKAACVAEGGDLTSISSVAEKKKVTRQLQKEITTELGTWWVGLKFNPTTTKFVWEDGEAFNRRITRWGPGEPNTGRSRRQDHCVELNYKGFLNDQECDELRGFVCEQHDITRRPVFHTTVPPITTTCKPLRNGTNRGMICSEGCSDTCIRTDGRCDCKPGYEGDTCVNTCPLGSYGANCSMICSEGCSDTCNRTDGRCDCKPGFEGQTCVETCQPRSYGANCSSICSERTNGCSCPPGSYGVNCSMICSEGCSDTCNRTDGRCDCKPGFEGDTCVNTCPSGTYGVNCRSICSKGCGDICDRTDGRCDCKPGYRGDTCVERCQEGLGGVGCTSRCSEGCVSCSLAGTCEPPCRPEWEGNSCQTKIIYCPEDEYNTTIGVFNIEKTPVGVTFNTSELCHVDGRPLGEVRCTADGKRGGNWSSFTTNRACDYSDLDVSDISESLTKALQHDEDIEEVIHTAVNISENSTLNQLAVLIITNIMEKTTNLSEVSGQVATGVLKMYSTVIETPESTLVDVQERAAALNRILRSVDDVTGKIQPGPSGEERVSSETFVSQVWDLTNPNLTNENLPVGLLLQTSDDNETSAVNSLYNKSVDFSQIDAAIILPRTHLMNLRNCNGGNDIRMSMNVYTDTSLFSKASTTEAKYRLNSKVVSAKTVCNGIEITDLGTERVTLIFSQTKVDEGVVKRCGYWNFSLSGWSTDGCQLSQGEADRDVCICDHLTNFAILMNVEGEAEDSSIHSLPLSLITVIGLSLSIMGLSGTLLSFILFRKLREKHPQQTLFNLALAELCAWLVFLAGITQTQSHTGCTLVAILLHYFLLASFMWMLAEAFLHYLLLVKARVQGSFTKWYILKTGMLAWGLPFLPVLIVLAVDPGLYRESDSHCWMSLSASLYAFALPVGIVIFFNIVIYTMVVVRIFKMSRAKGTKGSKKREQLKIRVPVLCFVLFGLSWTFGFLAVSEAKVMFQYLFCLTSSTQGVLIFIFFTAGNEEVRQLWSRLCFRKKRDLITAPVERKKTSTSIITTGTNGDIETSV